MRKAQFHTQLCAATYAALRFGQRFVKNRLPLDAEFLLVFNQSHDANRRAEEVVYPSDDGLVVEADTAERVTSLLYRDGRCPAWIDISVLTVRNRCSVMRLLCAGRYSADDHHLYYYEGGTQPFGIKSPDLPLGWRSGRFWLPRAKPAVAQWFEQAVPRPS